MENNLNSGIKIDGFNFEKYAAFLSLSSFKNREYEDEINCNRNSYRSGAFV